MKEFIKQTILTLCSPVHKLCVSWRIRERKATFGEDNPDKTFYIYGFEDNIGGIWWHINKVLMHIAYAKDKGYILVVDMKNYMSQYQLRENLGIVNVWELFFKQPFGYTLEDIKSSKNIVICKRAASPSPAFFMGQSSFYEDINRISYFHSLFKEYIVFSDATRNYLNII